MIQRIQSLFLLILCILASISLFMPYRLDKLGNDTIVKDNPIYFAILVGVCILSFVSIFLFKARKLQLWFSVIISISIIGLGVLMYIAFYSNKSNFLLYSFSVPAILLFINVLAYVNIRRDINIIKKSNSLR